MNDWQIWLWLIGVGGFLLCLTDVWPARLWRRALAIFSLIPLLAGVIFTITLPIPYWLVILIIFIEIFLILAAARAIQFGRPYQADMTGKNTFELLGLVALAAGASFISGDSLLWIALVIAASLSAIALGQLIYAAKRYQLVGDDQTTYESHLPTVSVCVPARNETHALNDCLKSLLASDYPKLEILVLDDCSQDKTAHIVRSFAHDGVRFIQGKVPDDNWLGKNQACAALAQEARGDILLFASVDSRIEPYSITKLVAHMQKRHANMLAVLPERHDKAVRASAVFAPLRYFWQVATPPFLNLPTTTALWLIRSKTLKQLGGFAAFSGNISPEENFAKLTAKQKKYEFLASNHRLGVYYAKKWQSQIDTGVRLWYPGLGRRPARVVLASLGQYFFIVVPYIVLINTLISWTYSPLALLAAAIVMCQLVTYGFYVYLVKPHYWLLNTIVWPVLALQEIALTLTSYIQYEFGAVVWKGRNVCYPVLALVSSGVDFGKSKPKVEP